MNEIIELFYKIQRTSSTKDKIRILSENSENKRFKKWLKYLVCGDVVTGISTKKLQKKVSPSTELSPLWIGANSEFDDVIDYLKKNNTGTDDDIYEIQCFLRGHEEDREFYEQMITKKCKLGADVKTINKAIPGLIQTWEVQQAYPLSTKNGPKKNEWFQLSQKLNGTNCGYLDGKLISRQGKEFTGLSHIVDDIQKLPFKDMFFNGELIRRNVENMPDSDNFQIGTGIINSDSTDKSCIKFVIYEMFPAEEFLKGLSKLTYKARKKTYLEPLEEAIQSLGLTALEVVPVVYQGRDSSVIQDELMKTIELDWEGLMLNKDTKWQAKRNNGILKVKLFKHADIWCTGVYEGTGRNTGTLGGLYCNFKGYQLGVGSGFSDEKRRLFWEHPESVVGKIVQIKYKVETKNKQGGTSAQFGTFECIREDKTEESYE